jgi:predicted metal-dependent phosphoesterase TrpH
LKLSTTGLTLEPTAAVDLQLHTHFSDGKWTPEQLITHLRRDHFGLAAITDHDRIDTAAELQRLALEIGLPLLVAVEMSASLKGFQTDILVFGFDPEHEVLTPLTDDLLRRQQDNTREVYANLRQSGYPFDEDGAELAAILAKPGAQQPHELISLVKTQTDGMSGTEAGKIVREAGGKFATNELAAVVEAAHRSDGVAIIAHPGRGDGFLRYDAEILDYVRRKAPIDGLEVFYPAHTQAQTSAYLEYARQNSWLISSGSDSHSRDRMPIKYPASQSRRLLERLSITIR